MNVMHKALFSAAVGICMLCTPASAEGYFTDFEDFPQGSTTLVLDRYNRSEFEALFGHSVEIPGVTIDAKFAARSGTKVYFGEGLSFVISDSYNYSWEYVSAYVTGEAIVFADYYLYNYETGTEEIFQTFQSDGPNTLNDALPPHFFLENLSGGESARVVRVDFVSDAPFSIDDFRVSGVRGIPEPSTWALVISGFGLVGAKLRRRRVSPI